MGGVKPTVSPGGGAVGQAALASQTKIATGLNDTGSKLTGMGIPQLQTAGNYFSTLASGNKAATAQALAPAASNINGVYGGTQRSLSRFLRGPERDTQMAETDRERAGAVSSLFRDAPGQANAQLATLGAGTIGQGLGASAQAGGFFGGQAQLSQEAQVEQNKQQQEAGSGFGGLLFNVLKSFTPLGRIGGR